MKKLLGNYITISILSLTLVIGILALPNFNVAKADSLTDAPSSNFPSALTVKDYEDYLQNYSTQDAIDSGVDPNVAYKAVEDSKTALHQFESLSSEAKQRFVNQLSNPINIPQNVASSLDLGSKKQIQVIDTKTNTVLSLKAASSTASHQVSYTGNIKIFGVSETSYYVSVGYHVRSGYVTGIYSSSGYVAHNYNPLTQTELSDKNSWITASKKHAATRSVFSYSVGPVKGLSAQLGSIVVQVYGNSSGDRSNYGIWRQD
jgi:hypothetical protein